MDRLCDLSVKNKYDAYADFKWPDVLPENEFWMGPELLTVAGTEYAKTMTHEQLVRLSKWESINLYSLVMYGERDLTEAVIQHIHRPGFEDVSEYFHHFIEEENKHMWFFSQFCLRYGGKFYRPVSVKFSGFPETSVQSYLAFSKIMIFEEIGDYFNVRIRDDDRVPGFIRYLNKMHHQDESRHLAMARRLLKELHRRVKEQCTGQTVKDVEIYLKRYMHSSIVSLYCPAVYRDSGLANAYQLRSDLLRHPARTAFHRQVLKRVMKFFYDAQLFVTEERENEQ